MIKIIEQCCSIFNVHKNNRKKDFINKVTSSNLLLRLTSKFYPRVVSRTPLLNLRKFLLFLFLYFFHLLVNLSVITLLRSVLYLRKLLAILSVSLMRQLTRRESIPGAIIMQMTGRMRGRMRGRLWENKRTLILLKVSANLLNARRRYGILLTLLTTPK